MYNEKVMEVFKNPQHMGEVENYNAIGTVGNEVCGDIMQITMRIEDNVIKDAKFKTFGCGSRCFQLNRNRHDHRQNHRGSS